MLGDSSVTVSMARYGHGWNLLTAKSVLGSSTWKAQCLRDWPGQRTNDFIRSIQHGTEAVEMGAEATEEHQELEMRTRWRDYYRLRYDERRRNLFDARCSLVYNLEVQDASPDSSPASDLAPDFPTRERWPTIALPSDTGFDTYFCNINSSLFSSPDRPDQFVLARRFLIRNMYICVRDEPMPRFSDIVRVDRVELTTHPCIVRVVLSDCGERRVRGLNMGPRRSCMCFVETMEVMDMEKEGTIAVWYRRLMDCDSAGHPKERIQGLDAEGFLSRLLDKEQTLMEQYPHAIST